MTAAFVVLLTVFVGAASSVKQYSVKCPDMACVAKLRDQATESPRLTRFQVWRAADYARTPDAGQALWQPVIDEQFQ